MKLPDWRIALHEQLLEHVPVGIFVLDVGAGEIEYANATLLNWLEVASMEELGMDVLRQSLLPEQMSFEELAGTLREDAGKLEALPREMATPSGSGRWIQCTCQLLSESNSASRIAVVIQDVTSENDSIEKALEESSLHSQLFSAAPSAIATVDNEDRIVRVNPAFERLFGYSESEALGKNIDDLIVPNRLRDEALKYSAGARSASPVQVETVRQSKSGRLLPTHIQGFPLRLHGGQVGFHAIYTDLTEQKKIESELNQLFDAAPCAIAMVDSSDRIVKVNAGFERMFGYVHSEVQGRILDDLIVPEDLREEGREYSARARTAVFLELESVRKRRDGRLSPVYIQVFPILYEGEQVGFYAIYTDLSEIKKVEAQLREHRDRLDELVKQRTQELEASQISLVESESRYRTYLAKAPIGVGVVGLDGRIVEVNEAMCLLTGFSSSEMKQKSILEMISPNDTDDPAERFQRLLSSSESSSVVLGRTKSQGDRYFLVTAASLGEEGFLMYAIDIHERKTAERQLEIAVGELERSNAELEQFAYVASHDLQEPLRMVGSFTGLLGRRYADQLDDRARKYIRFAVDGASRMQGLIDDLLTYSRVGRSTINRVAVPLGKVVEQAEANLQRQIEDERATVVSEGLPSVSGDLRQLEQLFQNLIQNAIKFRRDGIPARIRVSAERQGNMWRVAVADNGIGIPQEFQAQIFEIFQRLHTRDEFEGSGIGLSVCRKIVERHGGRMGVESDGEEGATFWFTLPPAEEDVI